MEEKGIVYYIVGGVILVMGALASLFIKNNTNELKGRLPVITNLIVSAFSGIVGGLLAQTMTDLDQIHWVAIGMSGYAGVRMIEAVINKGKKTLNIQEEKTK